MVFISEEEIETQNERMDEIETLKQQLAKKDDKLKNQASELNHLTNEVIPDLKKENKELKAVKIELTDALETSTKKYFDQLDINADLSNQIGKLGAEGAVNKVRADKYESEIKAIKEKDALLIAIPTKYLNSVFVNLKNIMPVVKSYVHSMVID